MGAEQHIIHRLILDVTTNSRKRAYAIKDDAVGFLSDRIAPRLEALFEELERRLRGRTLEVDQLTISVNTETGDLERGDLAEVIYNSLRERLFSDIDMASAGSRILLPQRRILESVLAFLQTGVRPWWVADRVSMDRIFSEDLLQHAVEESAFFRDAFMRSLDGNFRSRLIRQLPEETWISWFAIAFHAQRGRQFPSEIPKRLPPGQSADVWSRHFAELLKFPIGITDFPLPANTPKEHLAVNRVFQEKITGRAVLKNDILTNNSKSVQEEEQVIAGEEEFPERESAILETSLFDNAGLILLHPFLEAFFDACGLLDHGKQLTDKTLAAHLLHYLATHTEQEPEYGLRFEKFLCGIPAAHPLDRHVEIPEKMKEEAQKLLMAALGHWKALKSNSTELLQMEFLQREAKLICEEEPFRLIFERKTQDILLNSLPWNLSVVKLPWHKKLIYVEW